MNTIRNPTPEQCAAARPGSVISWGARGSSADWSTATVVSNDVENGVFIIDHPAPWDKVEHWVVADLTPVATVWVAVARYAREDDIDPIIVVGSSSDAAARALTAAIIATCPEGEEDASEPDDWIEENPIELPINR